ncbi:MAG TPA: phosphoribosylglycinamide formyltransferase [Rudaea sp.]|jgi:phosphoribosylglycinamide formyltransferase-1|uniref:phosphoribosylglycinamide formyltransferase n=1 Tax=Rudaea sp. TaxID=2136325 RepID=UPI002F91F7EF
MQQKRLRVVVLASGRGSNFAALLAAQQRGELPIDIRALLSDKATAPALDIARDAGIDAIALRPRDHADRAAFDQALFARVVDFHPDLVVLAGYMRVIDAAVVDAWRGRMINIHPSLLPQYPGLHTHQRALDANDVMHGASVHFVTAELDGGPVIAQAQLPILAGDNADSLAARLLPLEHRLLIVTVKLLAQGKIALQGNRVACDDQILAAPLLLDESGSLKQR